MKVYVTENAAYVLEDVYKVEKDESWSTIGYSDGKVYCLILNYNNRPKETIIYFTEEKRDKAFDEIINILKGGQLK